MKRLIKRYLLLGLSTSIAALTVLRSWAAAEIEGKVEGSDSDVSPPQPGPEEFHKVQFILDSATKVMFSGQIVRDGSRLLLRETGGEVYSLGSLGLVQPFEGEHVRVTGKLDSVTRTLHVDDIESLAA